MIALVTGANQGLGRALVEGLAPHVDRVLLTGRDPERVAAAADELGVEGRVLDVRDRAAIAALAEELGEVDIVFSNATARMSPEADPADEVDAVAETSNLATTAILRAFVPRMRPGGRLIVVASALGTLAQLDDPEPFAAVAEQDLDAVDALVEDWRAAVHAGRDTRWLNIPSKVAQVAAVRVAARERDDALIMALCPGLIDTEASRPWFADMTQAQTPAQAAAWPVELALAETYDPAFHGELVQFGEVLPWAMRTPRSARSAVPALRTR
jgi:NAD(P)-dependent dehydrogenase (short-subunit alcohol dehydrogenase family)